MSSTAPKKLPKLVPLRLVAGEVQERGVGELLGHRGHRVHVAERGADDEVEALAREAAEHLLGVGALGHQLHVGDVRVGHVLADVAQALVVGLAPAAVVVGPDEHHRDVELALLDVRQLPVRAARGNRAGAIGAPCRGPSGPDGAVVRRKARETAHCHRHASNRSQKQGAIVMTASTARFARPHGITLSSAQLRDLAAALRIAAPGGSPGRVSLARAPNGADMGATVTAAKADRGGYGSCTIGRDVRTDRAARRATRHQLPAARGAFGLHRRVRPGRIAPGIARARPASPTSWSTSPSRARPPIRRRGRSARRSRGSAARSMPRPTASRRSTGSASRAARRPGDGRAR